MIKAVIRVEDQYRERFVELNEAEFSLVIRLLDDASHGGYGAYRAIQRLVNRLRYARGWAGDRECGTQEGPGWFAGCP